MGGPPAGASWDFLRQLRTTYQTRISAKIGINTGITQASKSKPFVGGSASTAGPYCDTYAARIASSDSFLATRSSRSFCIPRAVSQGPENDPPGWLHCPAESSQPPHMHFRPLASFLARGAFWAKATGASDATSGALTSIASATSDAVLFCEREFVDLVIRIRSRIRSPRNRTDCRTSRGNRVAPRFFADRPQSKDRFAIRQQREDGPQHHYNSAKPNPLHQRQQVGVNHWLAAFRAASGVHHV